MGVGKIQRNQQAWWSTLWLATAELSPALGEGGQQGSGSCWRGAGTWELWPPERAAFSRKASRQNRHANHWLLQPSDHLVQPEARKPGSAQCNLHRTEQVGEEWRADLGQQTGNISTVSNSPKLNLVSLINRWEVIVLRRKKKVVPFHLFLVGSASCIIDNSCHMSGTEPDALLLVILCNLILIITVS